MKKPYRKIPDPARHAVWQCLRDIQQDEQTLDHSFEAHSKRLNPRDKAFAYNLTITTLRYGIALDKLSGRLMQKPFAAGSGGQLLLRLGLCQLFLMDGVKDHAAISATVDMAKTYNLANMSGVINGVLRNAQRRFKPEDIKPLDAMPGWLRQRLEKAYGSDKTKELAKALLTPAATDIRCRTGEAPEGAENLVGLPDGFRLPSEVKPQDLESRLLAGEVYIQDCAAQWPAFLLTQNLDEPGSVLDICAAPGGKTLQLADHTKRLTVAADISRSRLRLMGQNIATTENISLLQADGFAPPFQENSFAGILVDAPCTATGTIRRHPEVMHLRKESDIQTLRHRQRTMLEAMTPLLKPGGVLAYAVCSLLQEEGEDQHKWILENLPLEALALKDLPEEYAKNQPTQNALRLTPLDDCDGFYIALYRKPDSGI